MQNNYSKNGGKKYSSDEPTQNNSRANSQTNSNVGSQANTRIDAKTNANARIDAKTNIHNVINRDANNGINQFDVNQFDMATALELDTDSDSSNAHSVGISTKTLTTASSNVNQNDINQNKIDSKGAFLLNKIKDELVSVIGIENVNRWLDKLYFHKIDNSQFVIYAENKFVKQWVFANYAKNIQQALDNLNVDKTLKIVEKSEVEIENSLIELAKSSLDIDSSVVEYDNAFISGYNNRVSRNGFDNMNGNDSPFGQTILNNEMTFNNFIVGEFNQYAYEICNSIAKGNIGKFTPILIYGATGLGKTHLMNALTYSLRENYSKLKVKFINGKIFVDNVILATRQNLFNELYEEYESTDVFIIDDIQMLGKTTKSLEVFFYIFDSLYNKKKQIILTSDKNPKDMEEFEERYLSRFQGGPLFEIEPPNFEEKVALLQARAEALHINIDSDVVHYIARKIDATNIRELVGTVSTLALYDSFGKELTIEFVNQNLKNIITAEGTKELTIDDIVGEVCAYFRVKQADITSKLRTQSIVYARQVSMYFIREMLHYSLQDIADLFKIHQHTTVKYSINKIEEKIINDQETKLHIDKIRASIVG